MTRAALRQYERVIVMSQRMRAELATFHRRDHAVEVLPSGIDLTRFRPIDRQEARRQLGFANDVRPWVLFASLRANNPVKRPKLARAAFDWAQLRRTDLVLKTLHGVPHELVPLWMNAATVLLVTSTREGWPNVVKESLACNMPFVSTDVSDLARIAEVEPSCTVAAAAPDALAEGLLRAIEAPRSDSLRRHVEPMDMETTARRLCAIYEEVLGVRRRQAA
jgi:glycosyltransferase involved in cell wall biosynthesis